ncbi:MAG: Enolase [Candidatus Woesebacteria bacterium GW2011_GWA2_40_7]|uniref:Enolase n=1 Tax=Candidatus Woesebacteria bacterium GW2011_GWA2_40_7 TaxID=1618562 RepID=A0A0G0WDW9_9BACT|nr:MAG: Enolase [Candidatus Woesebacteria bacterium GW2011_GWA2_40_7]
MNTIKQVWAREIIDSRGVPTIETACQLDNGQTAVSSVPSGSSTGSHEATELRDKDTKRFNGLGVLQAVENVNKILNAAVVGMDPTDQSGIDMKMIALDGTENKSRLGGNALLSVSMVVAKVAAVVQQISLYNWINTLARAKEILVTPKIPTPVFNMINGGKHGAGNLDFQEFQVVPASNKTYTQGLQAGVEIYAQITSYSLGRDVLLGLDVAANEFFNNSEYTIRDKTSPLNEFRMMEFYKEINDRYKLALLEDPFNEDSWESWKQITAAFSDQLVIVGDDLLVTNPKRLDRAIKEKSCNAILVKPNQIGTVTQTLDVVKMAKDAGWKINVSHRSGETNDWFIADFAVGVASDYVKFGAPARGERVAKYNRLLSINTELQVKE